MEEVGKKLESGDYSDKIDGLKSVYAYLISLNDKPITGLLSIIPSSTFIWLLPQMNNDVDLEILMSVLEKVLSLTSNPGFGGVIERSTDIQNLLLSGVKHSSVRVRCFVVKQISRFTNSEENLQKLFTTFKDTFLKQIIMRGIADADLSVVKMVHKLFIEKISRSEYLTNSILFDKEFVNEFQNIITIDVLPRNQVTQKLRFFELYLSMSVLSAKHFEKGQWVIDQFLDLFKDYCEKKEDDVLVLLNIMELIKIIIPQEENNREIIVKYIESRNVFGKIFQYYLTRFHSDDFLEGFFFSYIGQLKALCSKTIKLSEPILERLFLVLINKGEEEDKKFIQICLEVIGSVVSCDETVYLQMINNRDLMTSYFGYMNEEDSAISSSFFYSFSTILQSDVLKKLETPFMERRIPILNLMKDLAATKFGTDELLRHPGFFPFIIDRETERGSKEGLQLKFLVIQNLLETMKLKRQDHDQKMMIEFMAYLKNGVFFNDNVHVLVSTKSNF